jgi:aerobic-type carbon monoxide dehydrogenase small subunit (CoxS/CutS family)
MPLTINGSAVPLPDDPRVSLLDLLREQLHLTGTKKGCNQGACGACTVLVDGERIIACLALAVHVVARLKRAAASDKAARRGPARNTMRRPSAATFQGVRR